MTRIPPGHPEGYLEAFANVYLGVFEAIRASQAGRELGPLEGQFPTVEDGARGVRFIERVVLLADAAESPPAPASAAKSESARGN